MGLFKRIKSIAKANINDVLDNCEDPSKMVDQYLREMTEGLAEVRQETASVMAEENRLKRLMDDNATEINKFNSLARRALVDGREEDARVFIEKKQALETKQKGFKGAYDVAHENAQKVRDTYDKLVDSIEVLQQKRSVIKAKTAVARVQQRANRLTGANSVVDAMDDFERMDARADALLDQVNAIKELDKHPADKAYDLAKQYGGVNKATVDDEIAKMKSELYIP